MMVCHLASCILHEPKRGWLLTHAVLACCLVAGPAAAQDAPAPPAQEAPKAKDAPEAKTKARSGRRAPGSAAGRFYMGRPIADVMTYEGADWLVRPEREQEEQPDKMLDALNLKPGDTVADVGAGVGYLSLRIARRVGPKGKVLATDLQPQMLQLLSANAKDAGLKNIQPIRCTVSDPKLPAGQVDLALMVDVYHECPQPKETLLGIRSGLKPAGRLVLVEFRAEDPDVPIKPEHKMTLAQVRKEVEPVGFTFKESLEFLPWQHIIIFEKSAEEPAQAPAQAKSDPEPRKPNRGP
jgi:ubiquinone/menaquinone biosynthesis C-methylase UbiE